MHYYVSYANLDLIANPITIESPIFPGARLMPVGGVGGMAMCFKMPRKGGAKTGNQKNARWRRRRGGSYCSPLNLKFKAGN